MQMEAGTVPSGPGSLSGECGVDARRPGLGASSRPLGHRAQLNPESKKLDTKPWLLGLSGEKDQLPLMLDVA